MDGAGELPSIDYKALFARVSANRDRMDACPRHSFPELFVTPRLLGQKAVCIKCGGEMDMVALNYYVRGYVAGGHSGNDIVPGWTEPGTEDMPKPLARTYFAPTDE